MNDGCHAAAANADALLAVKEKKQKPAMHAVTPQLCPHPIQVCSLCLFTGAGTDGMR
jgi:hypothetical protein